MVDLIIIGGGAAGLFMAANVENQQVILLEQNKILGKKMLLSGGGMCNLSNCDETQDFLKNFGTNQQSRFLAPALKNLSTSALKEWFAQRDFPLITREDGKVFPKSLKAESVVDFLRKLGIQKNVEYKTNHRVMAISKKDSGFVVKTNQGYFKTQRIAITTGGRSYETTGSDGSGYDLAKSLGHNIVEPTQALVGIYIKNYPLASQAGNSIKNSLVEFYRKEETKPYL
jgi:predicted Rossmann fold flavoprotein